MEARLLMLAPNNIFSPSSGKPITTPSQDIVLGCYYLTQNPRKAAQQGERLRLFSELQEIEFGLAEGAIKIHEKIRFKNPNFAMKTIYGNAETKVIETTAGRVIFNGIWPVGLGFFNKVTVKTLYLLQELCFSWASRAGCSIGIPDMIIPDEKKPDPDTVSPQIPLVEK